MSTLHNRRVPMPVRSNGAEAPEPTSEEERAEYLKELSGMDTKRLKRLAEMGKNWRPTILSVQERMDMEDRVRILEHQLTGDVDSADRKGNYRFPERLKQHMMDVSRISNPTKIKREIVRLKRRISNMSPDSISTYDQSALEKERGELAEWLKTNMAPRTLTQLRAGPNPDFRKAVNHTVKVENSKEFMDKAQRYKQVQRQLEPDDPDAENLENIRPES